MSTCAYGALLSAALSAADAQVVTTYEYDSRNRLKEVVRLGPPVRVSIAPVGSASEGSDLLFRITLDGQPLEAVEVALTFEGISAIAGPDFDNGPATVVFSPSDTQKTVAVPTKTDAIYEGSETVKVRITGVEGHAVITTDEATGTITNTTPAPSFRINDRTVNEGGNAVFTVTKTGQTVFTHGLSYTTQNGSAVAGQDYSGRSGTLSFTAGQTSKTISVPTSTDQTNEPNETFDVRLSAATNGATLADASGRGTIRNVFFNSPPSASNDAPVWLQAGSSTIVNVLANDTDPDGHALTVQSVSAPSFATVSIRSDNRLTIYGQSAGTGSVTYTISDRHGGTDTATIPLEVASSGGGFEF
ncbi:Calx-beta domain-containing protein [Parvularcula maris]|uniref:Ig-like domain-containing protein n=1 Tax=Parvularcula maris TaxID=2965077 RepID=A0A9X2LBG3_9PROT|nr:Calx-beta domain-containing protein [Parvularcula maris]MCQ8186640.1 Ig-like domain-containing protein [Parvularcula maris]